MTKSSEAPGFYKKDPSERLDFVKNFANLTEDEMKTIIIFYWKYYPLSIKLLSLEN